MIIHILNNIPTQTCDEIQGEITAAEEAATEAVTAEEAATEAVTTKGMCLMMGGTKTKRNKKHSKNRSLRFK